MKARVESIVLLAASSKLMAELQCDSNRKKIMQNHELLLRPLLDKGGLGPKRRFPGDLSLRTLLSWELERETGEMKFLLGVRGKY